MASPKPDRREIDAPQDASPGSDDTALLAAVRQGDRAAFALLVRRHATAYHRLAYRLLRQNQEAEEVVQDAFLRLWERPATYDPESGTKFTTWFYRVVTNLCLDRLRRVRPLGSNALPDRADPAEDQEAALLHSDERAALTREMAALPDRQRVALALCFFEGLSNAEAASAMGLRLKAFQSLLMRSKTALKARMTPYL